MFYHTYSKAITGNEVSYERSFIVLFQERKKNWANINSTWTQFADKLVTWQHPKFSPKVRNLKTLFLMFTFWTLELDIFIAILFKYIQACLCIDTNFVKLTLLEVEILAEQTQDVHTILQFCIDFFNVFHLCFNILSTLF